MAKAKKGGFFRKLFITLVLVVIGMVLGTSSIGWEAKKIYNTVRFRNAPIAQDFLSNPFSLKIVHIQDEEGLKTYLINKAKSEVLEVFEIEGTTQVGDASHRLNGIGEETRNKVLELLKDAKDGGSTTLDKAKELIDQVGK